MHQYHQPRAYEVRSFRRCFQHGRHLGKVEVPPSHGEGGLEGGVGLLQLVQASVPVISNTRHQDAKVSTLPMITYIAP